MRNIRCWLGHKWTFPTPHDFGGIVALWRGCMRCGVQQRMTVIGHWRYWNGHTQD